MAITTISQAEQLKSAYQDGGLVYYYESHPTKEELMAETTNQSKLIRYLVSVLQQQYRAENWFIGTNLNIYSSSLYLEEPIAPDVFVFKGLSLSEEEQDEVSSWKILEDNRPAPTVVFEIGSKNTWKADLEEKPASYGLMGVREYFAYDPNLPPLRKKDRSRLFGWSYGQEGQLQELSYNEQGWLRSEQLQSWLVPEGRYLRLYDFDLKPRFTGREAERTAKEAANLALDELRAKLKARGIDPDKL